MASLIFGSIGSALLGPIGGFIGSALGSMIDQWLFAPDPPDVEGPRLSDLNTVKADPGAPIPIVYGADRVPGIVLDTSPIIETVHKEEVGGKGGGPSQTVTSYTYHVDIDFLLCEGPILGVGRIWADGKLIRGTRAQMELNAAIQAEKVGAIPYSDWYKDYYYLENELPWSIDPAYTPTIGSQKYTYNPITDTFTAISDAVANAILADPLDVTVIYQQDSTTGYYIPIPASHDYTGERLVELPPTPNVISLSGTLANFTVTNGGPIDDSEQVINFIDFPDTVALEGTVNIQGRVAQSGSGPVDHYIGVTFRNASGGTIAGIPYNVLNEFRTNSSGPTSLNYDFNVPVPVGAVRMRITRYSTRFIPLFSAAGQFDFEYQLTATGENPGTPINFRDWPDYNNFYHAINDWSPQSVLQFHGAGGVAFYRGTDDQISDPTMQLLHPELACDVPAYIGRAHIVFTRLELERFGNRIPNMQFEVVQSDDARIRNVITDLMERAGLDTSLYDITALPTTDVPSHVLGYTIGRLTNFRAALETLLETFYIDAAEMGDQIVFRPRRRAPDHTIDYNDLAAVEATGSNPGEPIRLTFRDVVEMPARLSVAFKDPEREYQVNTAVASRQFAAGVQESSMELAAVIPGYIAKSFARDKLRDVWLERVSASATVPHKYAYISPSDWVELDGSALGKTSYVIKVTTVSRGNNGVISLEGVIREATLFDDTGQTDNNGMDNYFPPQSGPGDLLFTYLTLLDIPALRVDDSDAGFYYSMTGRSNDWQGAVLYRQTSGGAPYDNLAIKTFGTIAGLTREALPFAPAHVFLPNASVLVELINEDDVLSSITVDELFDGKNAAYIGGEIIQFLNVEDLGDNQYRLSGLIRGLLDTDTTPILSGHAIGDDFVMLGLSLGNVVTDISRINTSYNYKGVTFGANLSQFDPQAFTNTGSRLRPFRPRMVTGTRDMSNNLTISWVRQDRLLRNWPDNTDIALSETEERYQIDIYNGAFTAVLRTIEVTGATTASYTAAQQTTDGLTPGNAVNLIIYQISDMVGRGNAARETV
jgi:hypothetical protein